MVVVAIGSCLCAGENVYTRLALFYCWAIFHWLEVKSLALYAANENLRQVFLFNEDLSCLCLPFQIHHDMASGRGRG